MDKINKIEQQHSDEYLTNNSGTSSSDEENMEGNIQDGI